MMQDAHTLDRFLPKYMRLKGELLAEVKRLPVGASLPTVSEIRQRFKVSQPTVDRAIQELRFEGMVDSRRGSGIYVTPRAKARSIGIVFGFDLFGVGRPAFGRELLSRFQQRAGESLIVRYYLERMEDPSNVDCSQQLRADVEAGRLDTVLYLGVWHSRQPLAKLGVPIVALTPHPSAPYRATIDAGSVVRLGVEALVSKGRKNIALFAHDNVTRGEEEAVFASAIERTGAFTRPEWELRWSQVRSLEILGFREFLRWWNGLEVKPDGLVCADDNVTSGLLQAADELGIKIPDELLIASHSNSGMSNFHGYPVIRMEVDFAEMIDLLMARLEAATKGLPPDPVVLKIKPNVIIPGALGAPSSPGS